MARPRARPLFLQGVRYRLIAVWPCETSLDRTLDRDSSHRYSTVYETNTKLHTPVLMHTQHCNFCDMQARAWWFTLGFNTQDKQRIGG